MAAMPAFRRLMVGGKRVAVTVVGSALVVAGLVASVTPLVPGFLLVIAGLSLLGTEYAWARRALRAARRLGTRMHDRVRRAHPRKVG